LERAQEISQKQWTWSYKNYVRREMHRLMPPFGDASIS
jgi:hypothetical protein